MKKSPRLQSETPLPAFRSKAGGIFLKMGVPRGIEPQRPAVLRQRRMHFLSNVFPQIRFRDRYEQNDGSGQRHTDSGQQNGLNPQAQQLPAGKISN